MATDFELTIVIPTHNRPQLLPRAARSALEQGENVEVVIVDDRSDPPASSVLDLPDEGGDRLRIVRLEDEGGGAKARNVGLSEARGKFVAFLDDDDELKPDFAARSLAAWRASTLPPPVAVLSGLEAVDPEGRVRQTHLPPTLARGRSFQLESIPKSRSFFSKQTLVCPRDLLLELGGFDPEFRSRVHSDLFLRLNPICTLEGIDAVTYRLHSHRGERVSGTLELRVRSFEQLIEKHIDAFESHPRGYARLLCEHAAHLLAHGERKAALATLRRAIRRDPCRVLRQTHLLRPLLSGKR